MANMITHLTYVLELGSVRALDVHKGRVGLNDVMVDEMLHLWTIQFRFGERG